MRPEAQRAAAVLFSVVVVSGCATTATLQKSVDMKEARRVVGTENEVRIDAAISGDQLSTSTTLQLKYDITNNRDQPILIADMVPDATYDQETQMVTITIGSEVPGWNIGRPSWSTSWMRRPSGVCSVITWRDSSAISGLSCIA